MLETYQDGSMPGPSDCLSVGLASSVFIGTAGESAISIKVSHALDVADSLCADFTPAV